MSELRQYEITFIAEPNFDDERINAVIAKYTEQLKKLGGEVQKVDRVGKKRLAYPIEKRQYGYYIYSEVLLPGEALIPVKRWFALSDDIFRHLAVRMSDRDIRFKALTQDRYRREMERRNSATRPGGGRPEGGREDRPRRENRPRKED